SSLWANDFLLTPRIEALTMLAAAAPVTRNVTLGTAALLPVLRRPVQAAQTLASIDRLSGGRLVLTVGAAFPGRFGVPQHVLSDVPWERRVTPLGEAVALWRPPLAAPGGGGAGPGAAVRLPAGSGARHAGPAAGRGDGRSPRVKRPAPWCGRRGPAPEGAGAPRGPPPPSGGRPRWPARPRHGGPPVWLGGAIIGGSSSKRS